MAEQNLNFDEDEPLSLAPDDEPAAPIAEPPEEEEAISIVETEGEGGATSMRAFGMRKAAVEHKDEFRRKLNLTGAGATRCKIYHSKIAEASLEYMQDQINEWIDSENVEVKHVGHVIGVMEGKIAMPNMIVMVWY